MMKRKHLIVLALAASLLVSCGGNSVSSNSSVSESAVSSESPNSSTSDDVSSSNQDSLSSPDASSSQQENRVTSIQLSISKASLEVGESATLSVSILPDHAANKQYAYSVSKENIVSISGDTVSALNTGKVTITVTSSDGGLSDSVDVEVKERRNVVSDLDFISGLHQDEYTKNAYPTTSSWGVNDPANVGVNQNLLNHEERYPVPTENVTTYVAEDYGISADGTNNAGKLTLLLKDLAEAEGTKVIRFKANTTYRFGNVVNGESVKDCYIVGGTGTKFVYTGWMSYIVLSQCVNFHINNIIFDINPSPTITGKIVRSEETSSSADIYVKPDEGYDLSNSEYQKYSLKKTASYAEYYYDDEFEAYVPDRYGNLYYNPGITNLAYDSSTGLLKVSLSKSFAWCSYKTPENGTIVSVAFQVYESHGFYFKECTDTYMENVTTYTVGGMGLRTDNGKNLYLNRVKFIREPGTKRLLTCTADILHTCNLEGDAVFSNCVLEGSHDDAINVKSFYTKIDSIKGNKVTVTQTQSEVTIGFAVGDKVDVYNPTGMKYMDTFTVTAVSKSGSNYDLTLDKNMPSRGSNSYLGFNLGNATKAVHLTLENSVIKNKRNRGILLQGRDSVIKNCTFSNVNMGAIQILGVDDTFKEAIVPENIKVYNTKFLNCWDDLQVFTFDANGNSTAGTLKNVEIYNNFFYHDTGNSLYMKGVGDVRVHDNLFYEKPTKSYSCRVDYASDVTIENNAYYFGENVLSYNFVSQTANNQNISVRENILKGVL